MKTVTSLLGAAAFLLLAVSSCLAAEKPLAEWTFDRPGDAGGWQPNSHLTNVVVANGVLACRAVGDDPILTLGPLLNFKASSRQVVQIRLKADRDGTAELYWSNTSTGRLGGFSAEKVTRFKVAGDGQWHTYGLLPGWHGEGRIVRLRFDVYDGARFELDSIRVLGLETSSATSIPDFDFGRSGNGWQWLDTQDAQAVPVLVGREFRSSPSGLLLSPPLQINADEQSFVAVRFAADRGQTATLFFFSEKAPGFQSFSFPIESDGRERTYNLNMSAVRAWRGRVVGLGLRPVNATNAAVRLGSLKVGDAPQGPPELKLLSFALEDALPRAGVPANVVAWFKNTGGQAATNVSAKLRLPDGVTLLEKPPLNTGATSADFEEKTKFSWIVQAGRPLEGKIQLELAAANAGTVTASAPVKFTARQEIAKTGYVPEPKPVRGPYDVGVYYFPGWKLASQWQPVRSYPERKPVLGWYREGEPEIADWHIKWAVEHGITFFAYDWYWTQGSRQLEHALHDGYFKARYRHLLKFCLLWANHNPPHTSSHEDCLAVTRHWIENYFRRPEHLTFDGKPVMIIFSPHRLTEDLGHDGVKRAFEAMREECRRAGLKGLYLVAGIASAGGAQSAAAEGYDSATAYNWPSLGMTGESKFAPFETLVPGYRRQWEDITSKSPIPLTPLPVCGGWDSRPWHGDNNYVRYGRTPELFKRHLLDARQMIESGKQKSGTPKAILVEAWNEFGEGSYIEPMNEFGFGYLDAIRDVFTAASTPHQDVTPTDAGLGPYDVPPQPVEAARVSWEFNEIQDGWRNAMQLSEVKVAGGSLKAATTGIDPAFFGPAMKARAREFSAVTLRMKLALKDGAPFSDQAQLFWSTTYRPQSESSSVRFPVQGDGQWHEYRIPVAQNPRWRDTITALRFDPCSRSGVAVELDFIRLEK